ncbi:MAG: hypothetical protein PW790_14750 [Parvibaculaceae bacterium]|nr:hypothetical protein [Parvibaculaceae bacterium]
MIHALRRIMLAALLVPAAGTALSGCGFQPMYAESTQNAAADRLAAIDVTAPHSPLGREIQYDLFNAMNAQGLAPSSPLYQLNISPAYYEQDVAVELNTNVSRRNYVLVTQFVLVDLQTNKPVFSGSSRSSSSYNRFESEFANLSASEGAMKRTSQAVADDIKTQLAVYFTRENGK